MASSIFILATFSLSFLFTCHADLISDLCSATSNYNTSIPSICNKTLRSDPAALAAPDFVTLGKIVVRKSETAALDLAATAKKIGGKTGKSCAYKAKFSLGFLQIAEMLMGRRNKHDLMRMARLAMTCLVSCSGELDGHEPAGLREALVQAWSLDVMILIAAVKY